MIGYACSRELFRNRMIGQEFGANVSRGTDAFVRGDNDLVCIAERGCKLSYGGEFMLEDIENQTPRR